MDGRKLDLNRLSKVMNATESDSVKAVCSSLLDKDDDAINILEAEAEKRFSKTFDYLRWPALAKHHPRIEKIRTDLLRAQRCLNDLPSC
jgi:hypothetical protein